MGIYCEIRNLEMEIDMKERREWWSILGNQ